MGSDFPHYEHLINATRTSSLITSSTTPVNVPLETRLPFLIILIVLYTLIFFFGITGNALVVCKSNTLKDFLSQRRFLFFSCGLSK